MKLIYKYDETNKATHLSTIQVEDDHVLADDELENIPADFITPAKLVDGKIISSTLEESNEYYNVEETENKPSTEQMLTKQIMALSAENNQLKNNQTLMQKQLMQMSKTILGGSK